VKTIKDTRTPHVALQIVGLTGGSGVGKSTVRQVWAKMGAYAIDADEVYHRLLREDTDLLAALQNTFPEASASGTLDRKELGRMVFAAPKQRRELERITHGPVVAAVEQELASARRQGYKVVAVEALYLLETPLREGLSAVVGVIAPQDQRIQRIVARDGVSRNYAAHRIAAQPDDDYYRARCTHILENNAGTETLIRWAEELFTGVTIEN